ncbi:MAG: hypothetical protein U1F76_31735 [Candidatus Competibacteraceae bacterium]
MPSPTGIFTSFWLAGFEGADHSNSQGLALDMNAITQHRSQARQDYRLLSEFNIRTIRESVGWRLVETNGTFDFSPIASRVQAIRELGLQVNWILCHYGWPGDIDIFSPEFVTRFARYCEAVARYLRSQLDAPRFYTPINEISFLAWAVCESRLIYPYTEALRSRSYEFKQQLVRAVLAGCDAIWSADPEARIIHPDPVIHIIAPSERPDLAEAAELARLGQFQAWDMLRGSLEPQLGGAPHYLDIMGINYYHSNQWEFYTDRRLHWHLHDPRRIPFSQILKETYDRYRRPLFIAETSHVGVGRGEWITEIAHEAGRALEQGVPLEGICLYPILDRPDWEDLTHWHNSGLWDFSPGADGTLNRVLNEPYAHELRMAQRLLEGSLAEASRSPDAYQPN